MHWVESPQDHENRKGETLATRNHDVIRRWADERQAEPATVGESGAEARVLRFDFPGYGGENLRHISWDEWFQPFDERNLTFIFQEHKTDGSQSNFFQLDNPEREDG